MRLSHVLNVLPFNTMPQLYHSASSRGQMLRNLLCNFVALHPEEFLCYLHPLLSETQWDRVKEGWITTLVLYNDKEKRQDLNQLITDVATESANLNLIVQEEKGGPFKVYTYGDPRENRFVFVRDTESEVVCLCEEIDSGNAVIIQVF